MPSRTSLSTLTVLALLLPGSVSAGIPVPDQTAKQVSKQLEVDTKTTLKTIRSGINEATSALNAALKPITQAFKKGEGASADAQALFDALVDFQTAMSAVAEDAEAVNGALFTGLGSLLPSDDSFAGEYPRDFMPGAAGTYDGYVDDVDRLLAKPYPSLRKKLAKLVSLAEKKSDLLLCIRISPVNGLFEQAINTNAVTDGGRLPLSIDLSMSAHDSENVRSLRVAGVATNFGGDLKVLLLGEGSSTQDAVFSGARYQRSFVGFNPGNYLFEVRAEGDDYSVRQGIGLR